MNKKPKGSSKKKPISLQSQIDDLKSQVRYAQRVADQAFELAAKSHPELLSKRGLKACIVAAGAPIDRNKAAT
jgi:hypothetical protein